MENTLVIITPDAVRRGLVGEIIKRFEAKALAIEHIEIRFMPIGFWVEQYSHLELPVRETVVDKMRNGPSVFINFVGDNAAKKGRAIIGSTNADDAPLGTIRGDYGNGFDNMVQASDSPEAAREEIARLNRYGK